MVSFLLMIILLIGIYTGARRGLVLQVVYTVGYLISFIVAAMYFGELGPKLEMYVPYPSATQNSQLPFFDESLKFSLDQAFYCGVAFVLILFAGWLITRLIGGLLNRLTFAPILKQINWIGGGFLGFITVYIGTFLVLYLMSMLPMPDIQNALEKSFLAKFMIQHTPILSKQVYDWWVQTKI